MLEPIVASTRLRVAAIAGDVDGLRRRALDAPHPRGFAAALKRPGLSVVAEIKRRSPSRGDLDRDLDPVAQAQRYASGGSAAISVLTEPDHFSGSDADLMAVRAAVDLPILRKDFTIHPAQVWEARVIGADAVLLIVAILDDEEIRTLLEVAEEAALGALVEVHDETELERALRLGASVVGVNNRNLRTFDVDLATAERLGPMLTGVEASIAESGILGRSDAARMAVAGFDAVLVGESLVKAPDPAALIADLRAASSEMS